MATLHPLRFALFVALLSLHRAMLRYGVSGSERTPARNFARLEREQDITQRTAPQDWGGGVDP